MVPLTVLLPVYNAEETIGLALQSVLQQSFSDFELLAVDDGSTDGTMAILQQKAAEDPRIRVLPEPHRGIVGALNAGLSELGPGCRYVARMDADDRMHPRRLEKQVHALESQPQWGLVASCVQLDPPGGGMQAYVDWMNALVHSEDISREIFVESPLCHPSVLLRRTVLEQFGGYREMGWAEDYDLWLRIHAAGIPMGKLPEVLHIWRDHPHRLTRTDPRYRSREFFRLKAHFLSQWLDGRARVWGAGRDGCRLARELEENGVEIEVFFDIDPGKIGNTRRRGVPVRGPDAVGPPDAAAPIVAVVGVPGARDLIREALVAEGYQEGLHFICAA